MSKFKHKEAFALMNYACKVCGHREIIWNSRDGVTPFGSICPSCGEDLIHLHWHSDVFAPHHNLRSFQKFWRDGTNEEARAILKARLMLMINIPEFGKPESEHEEIINRILSDTAHGEFQKGWPILDIKLPKRS